MGYKYKYIIENKQPSNARHIYSHIRSYNHLVDYSKYNHLVDIF